MREARIRESGQATLAALGAVLLLAVSPVRADDAAAEVPTWSKDVAPIVYQRCAHCHRPGQIGPMSFLSYDEVRPWAKSISKVVGERTMPPWHADPAYGHFKNDARLSDAEVSAIAGWVAGGAPQGAPAEAPPPPSFDDSGWMIGKPDQIFSMEPFHVPDELLDKYEHFVIPSGLEEDKYVQSLEIRAGKMDSVHHVLVFLLPEDNQSKSVYDGSALMNGTFLTGWAPGTNPLTYQNGYGKMLPKGCNILFQVHYHKEPGAGTGGIDQSMMGVKYYPGPVEHPTTTAWVMDPTIALPPNDPDYYSASQFKFVDDGWILGMVPHMHLRGKSFRFTAKYPDGQEEILLDVPKYDFNWQTAYECAEPKSIPKGTTIVAEARYDNSTGNPANPDPNSTIYFGPETTDEMMIGFMEYAYVSRKKMQAKFGMPEKLSQRMGSLGGFEAQMMERAREGRGGREGGEGRRGRRFGRPGAEGAETPEAGASAAPAEPGAGTEG